MSAPATLVKATTKPLPNRYQNATKPLPLESPFWVEFRTRSRHVRSTGNSVVSLISSMTKLAEMSASSTLRISRW